MIVALLLLLPLARACTDCIEETDDVANPVHGACCLGDKSVGSDYTEARCPYVWAGPGTSAADCAKKHPCCFPYQNGTCTLELCFDCITKNGLQVRSCSQCVPQTTTIATTKPATTLPPQTLPPHSGTEATVPCSGCCCIAGSSPRVLSPEACHARNGTYRGDGTTCHETDICVAQCCALGPGASRACQTCPVRFSADQYRFVTFDDECPAEACGVSCCLNVQAIEARSSEQCEEAGGVAFPDTPLAELRCGGGCCDGLQFSIVRDSESCGGRYLGDGVGYSPGVCGGCCCGASGQSETLESACDGVYQGDDVPCAEDVCLNDGCCCAQDGSESGTTVASSRACHNEGGVFLGEGVDCTATSCQKGVCCAEHEFGGILVNGKAECDLRNGHYAGDGSTLDMPGICSGGGACVCGSKCIDVPDAATCERIHGDSFRGVGTSCDDPIVVVEGEGSCCVPSSFHNDESLCTIQPTEARCEFLGGVWGGADSECERDTCKTITGACCTTDECHDGLTLEECRISSGHWGGAESLCSDEYSCKPQDKGACCRDAHDCSLVSVTACHRVGGRFQGFNSTCSDQICKHCTPCEANAPECSDALPCANPLATCVKEFGKCMIIAAPIASQRDTNLSDFESADEPAKRKRAADTTNYAGPLLCSADTSTLGLPCIAKPLLGKCRVGVCVPPPPESLLDPAQCGSVCRNIHEYPCGCACEGDWLKKCASIHGSVVDQNGDGVLNALIELFLFDNEGGFDFVSEQHTTSEGGQYAFTDLAPGKYKVRVQLPSCYLHATGVNHRIVILTCTESAHIPHRVQSVYNRVAAAHSFQLEHRENGVHLAEHIDFATTKDCTEADKQVADENGDIGQAPGALPAEEASSPGSSSSITVLIVVLVSFAVLVIVLVVSVYICNQSRSSAKKAKK
jgi:hypothetical protein